MYSYAFKNIWNDKRVVAVTPFILSYPQEPFAEFSWKKADSSFHPYYSSVQAVSKIAGEPVQISSGQILGAVAQPVVLFRSDFVGAILARNTGQSIWNTKDVLVVADTKDVLIKSYSFPNTEPTRLGLVFFKASLQGTDGFFSRSLFLSGKNGKRITNSFPIEGVITTINKVQVLSFFAKIGSYLQSSLNLKF